MLTKCGSQILAAASGQDLIDIPVVPLGHAPFFMSALRQRAESNPAHEGISVSMR